MSSDGWPDEDEQEVQSQPALKFGKHRDKAIDEPSIPVDYLQWLVDDSKGERPVKSDWMAGKIMAEIQRRLEAGEVPEVRSDAARAGSTARVKRPTGEHPVNATPDTPARDTRLLLLLQDCVNRLTRIEAHLGVKVTEIPLPDDEVF